MHYMLRTFLVIILASNNIKCYLQLTVNNTEPSYEHPFVLVSRPTSVHAYEQKKQQLCSGYTTAIENA